MQARPQIRKVGLSSLIIQCLCITFLMHYWGGSWHFWWYHIAHFHFKFGTLSCNNFLGFFWLKCLFWARFCIPAEHSTHSAVCCWVWTITQSCSSATQTDGKNSLYSIISQVIQDSIFNNKHFNMFKLLLFHFSFFKSRTNLLHTIWQYHIYSLSVCFNPICRYHYIKLK